MSTPPVPPAEPDQPNGQNQPPQYGQQPPQYGQNQPPQYGQNQPPQYGQQAPQYGQPQYGQNQPYGQPQYGQNQPQYGQPQYGGYPGLGPEKPAGPVALPKEVNLAFWLIIGAGILGLIGIPFNIAAAKEAADSQLPASGANITPEEFNTMLTAVVVVFAVVGAALYALIAVFVRKGANWARIVATVFAVISLTNLFGGLVITVLQVLLGMAAVVLLYLKPSNEYFRASRKPKYGQF